MRLLVYLIGPPGAGKTTCIQTMTEAYDRTPITVGECPFEMLTAKHSGTSLAPPPLRFGLPEQMWELGRTRSGLFSGTDALSMSIGPKAQAALRQFTGEGTDIIIAEGDRLASARFFQGAEEDGWNLHVVYLATPLPEAAERRRARGTKQNAAWVQGRITKTHRLAERFGAHLIAGSDPPAIVADRLAEIIKYALQATSEES